jgi:lipoate-protein ligase A
VEAVLGDRLVTAPLVERASGSAGELHARPFPDRPARSLWSFDVSVPAMALGSRQPVDSVDVAACAREGIEVVRRRSGGGAVLLLPGEVEWVDLVVPAGDAGWTDDLRASMVQVGERWCEALDGLVTGIVHVHRGGVERTAWSDLVCFAGVGPGEVLIGDRKLVGISQRRTRAGARFQCAIHRRYDAVRTASLLAGPLPAGPPPDAVAVLPPEVGRDELVARLVEAFTAG